MKTLYDWAWNDMITVALRYNEERMDIETTAVFINVHLAKLNTKLERQKQAANSTQLEIEYWQARQKQQDQLETSKTKKG